MAKQARPEREPVISRETVISSAAVRYIDMRPPSGSDNQTIALRAPWLNRADACCSSLIARPMATGIAISIHPAKWFLFTYGPNGVVSLNSGSQKP